MNVTGTAGSQSIIHMRLALGIAVLSVQTFAAGLTGTAQIRAGDILAGEELAKLSSRRWAWQFDRGGGFEVAVRKSAIPIEAPGCRTDYLILAMPVYYPENPKQAPLAERRAVYDALLQMKRTGTGSMTVRFETEGPKLATCNIYFTLPLPRDAAKISP